MKENIMMAENPMALVMQNAIAVAAPVTEETTSNSNITMDSTPTRFNPQNSLEIGNALQPSAHADGNCVGVGCAPLESLPPKNFAVVQTGIYRSSYPQPQDYAYLQTLKLKTIITLVDKESPEGYQSFMADSNIRHVIFAMEGTKKAAIPVLTMEDILQIVTDRRQHPILIHCNQGKHRTGCVVGALRKVNGWDTDSVLDEYSRFAEPKIRETDVEYLRAFNPCSMRSLVGPELKELQELPLVARLIVLILLAAIALGVWVSTSRIMRSSLPRESYNLGHRLKEE